MLKVDRLGKVPDIPRFNSWLKLEVKFCFTVFPQLKPKRVLGSTETQQWYQSTALPLIDFLKVITYAN